MNRPRRVRAVKSDVVYGYGVFIGIERLNIMRPARTAPHFFWWPAGAVRTSQTGIAR